MYDEYIDARNDALYIKLNELSKDEIIRMILGSSSNGYLENMYEALCG